MSQRVLLNTDWMAVSILLDDDVKRAPKGHVWKLYENGTNVWSHRRVLYNDRGDKVCTLLSKPKSKLIDPRAALLEVANEWLYHGIGVRNVVDMVNSVCPHVIRGMSRCDLCFDFVPTDEQVEIIEGLANGNYYVSGKRSGSGFWSMNNDDYMPNVWRGRRIPHCISWGHKTSDVKWKLYYKTKELRDAAGGMGFEKPYIVDMWRLSGFDVDNVWRLEVSVKGCNNITWNGQPFTFFSWGYHTKQIAMAFYNSRFQIRKNEGHKDKSNDTLIEFLPIETAEVVRCRTHEGEKTHSSRLGLLRSLLKALETDEVLLDETSRINCIEHVSKIVKADGLKNYFKGMVGMALEDYVTEVNNRACKADGYTGMVLLERDWKNTDITPNTTFEKGQQDGWENLSKRVLGQFTHNVNKEADFRLF